MAIRSLAGYGSGYGISRFSVWGANAVSDFESIATVTVGAGGTSSINFTSIPQTYTHLQIRGIFRDNQVSGINNASLRINGDTASNYAVHDMYGNGSNALASNGTARTSINSAPWMTSAGSFSGNFAASIIDILDYTSTSKTKVVRVLQGGENNFSGIVLVTSGLWNSTSAVTSLTILSGTNTIQQYSTAALYGIRA
jgi:hypothetical protein